MIPASICTVGNKQPIPLQISDLWKEGLGKVGWRGAGGGEGRVLSISKDSESGNFLLEPWLHIKISQRSCEYVF